MTGEGSWLAGLGRRLARDDEGVSEVVSYALMFALGAIALVFSMDVLVDAQDQGSEIAAAQQVNAIGQATATSITDAARAAESSPNATFETTLEFPEPVQSHNFTIHLDVPDEPDPDAEPQGWEDFWHPEKDGGCPVNPSVRVATGDERITSTVPLDNRTTAQATSNWCLVLDTQETIDASDGGLTIRFERTDLHGNERLPVITMTPADR